MVVRQTIHREILASASSIDKNGEYGVSQRETNTKWNKFCLKRLCDVLCGKFYGGNSPVRILRQKQDSHYHYSSRILQEIRKKVEVCYFLNFNYEAHIMREKSIPTMTAAEKLRAFADNALGKQQKPLRR